MSAPSFNGKRDGSSASVRRTVVCVDLSHYSAISWSLQVDHGLGPSVTLSGRNALRPDKVTLEYCRLLLQIAEMALGKEGLGQCDSSARMASHEALTEEAQRHLADAAKMVDHVSYGRRRPEVLLAAARLGAVCGSNGEAKDGLAAAKEAIARMRMRCWETEIASVEERLDRT